MMAENPTQHANLYLPDLRRISQNATNIVHICVNCIGRIINDLELDIQV